MTPVFRITRSVRFIFLFLIWGSTFGTVLRVAADQPSSPQWTIARKPEWILRANPKLNIPAIHGPEKSGEIFIVFDQQVNLATDETYTHCLKQIVSESGVQYGSQLSFNFDPSYQHLVLHTIRVHRGTNIFDQLDAKKIKIVQQEKDLERLLYNGRLSALIFLEDVRVNDLIEFSYTVRGVNPIFQSHYSASFLTQWQMPVKFQYYRILCPTNRTLFIKNYATPVQPMIRETNHFKEYIWQWRDLKAVTIDDMLPVWFNPYPTVRISEFRDWHEVALWAFELYQVPENLSPELSEKINLWKTKYPTVEGQVIAALQFLQDEVRYLGIEFGAGSHQPTEPSVVFSRRFGDCKDKAFLLCTMLRHLDVNAWPILVNTMFQRTIQLWHPSPDAFNHVVVEFELNGKIYHADPTSSYQRGSLDQRYFPMYGAGLAIHPDTTALTLLVPTGTPRTTVSETFTFRNTNGLVDLTVKSKREGGNAEILRARLANMNQSDLDKLCLNYYASTYPKIILQRPVAVRDYPEKNTIETTETYRIPDIWNVSKDGTRVGCTFYPQGLRDLIYKPQRHSGPMPLGLSYPINYRHVTEVILTEPWTIKPAKKVIDNKAFKFSVEVVHQKPRLTLEYNYQSKVDALAASDVPEHAKNVDRLLDELPFVVSKPLLNIRNNPALNQPNWSVLLGALLFTSLLLIGAVALYFYKRGQPPILPIEPQLQGIGGWLILIAIGLCSMPLRLFVQLVRNNGSYSTATWQRLTMPGSEAYHSLWAPALLFGLLGNLLLLVFSSLLLVFFFQKRRIFPALFIAFLWLNVLIMGIDLGFAEMIPGIASPNSSKHFAPLTGTMMAGIIWTLYFILSRRVKSTFLN